MLVKLSASGGGAGRSSTPGERAETPVKAKTLPKTQACYALQR